MVSPRNFFRRSGGNSNSQENERPLPPPPRLPVPEEDKCPVCHQEYSSASLADREAHVDACFSAQSTPPSHNRANSSGPVSSSMSPHTPERTQGTGTSNSSSAPGRTPRRSVVVPFKASEKDCQNGAECQICLEEFEEGVPMGRLECFCKFHLHCIEEWFGQNNGQNQGRCPVPHFG